MKRLIKVATVMGVMMMLSGCIIHDGYRGGGHHGGGYHSNHHGQGSHRG